MHVHTDRHNIPNHPIQQKVDNEPTADPAPDQFHDADSELDVDTPIQEAWKAAFIEPLACSIHAVELGGLLFEDVVVVSGCGPLGLGMLATAKLKNPKLLIALDLYDWKVSWLAT